MDGMRVSALQRSCHGRQGQPVQDRVQGRGAEGAFEAVVDERAADRAPTSRPRRSVPHDPPGIAAPPGPGRDLRSATLQIVMEMGLPSLCPTLYLLTRTRRPKSRRIVRASRSGGAEIGIRPARTAFRSTASTAPVYATERSDRVVHGGLRYSPLQSDFRPPMSGYAWRVGRSPAGRNHAACTGD